MNRWAFYLLTSCSRTAPLRQQTLASTLDWSFALLTAKEQKVLQRLSIFSGGTMLEAVEAVCSKEDEAPAQALYWAASLAYLPLNGYITNQS